jgi:hypothetical protein
MPTARARPWDLRQLWARFDLVAKLLALSLTALSGCFMAGYEVYLPDASDGENEPPGPAPDASDESRDDDTSSAREDATLDAGPVAQASDAALTAPVNREAGMDAGPDDRLDGGGLDAAESTTMDASTDAANPDAAIMDASANDAALSSDAAADASSSACVGQDACAPRCDGGSCNLDCADAGTCNVSCQAGETCSVLCDHIGGTCNVTCQTGSDCQVYCTNIANCPVVCESGARCMTHCSSGGSCGFTCLAGRFGNCGSEAVCGGAECAH